ncbi:hypothetical protein FE257_006871 [Aspergillus nanangensis]|uniref:Uncharacterized protein n=1 Tax=Aspergillus nanangensis TaxID=2582783 RepID=A0AAD4GUJ5_ASPNN|nr:hypothetical protein FE257_006871 [Aspergillus nanangensis]
MGDTTNALSREVERLATAPYAPSLQNLSEISQNVSTTQLQTWVSHKPCQVGPLVDIVVDGLPRSGVALNLIKTFGGLSSIRDALLERYPYLLDQFLQRSIEDGDVELMNGLKKSPRLLFEVPEETMSSLQMELTKTLRNSNDHMGNLLCLAIFAHLASSWKITRQKPAQAIPAWLEKINHFFGPKRGMKTLDLVVLRVILACSASCNSLTVDQAAEGVRLAIGICDTLEQEQREAWIGANAPKIAKLCEKVTRSGINPEVQILGVTFLATLLPPTALSPGVTGTALQWLVSKDSDRMIKTLPFDLISRVANTTAASLGQPAINNLLKHILSTLRIGSPSNVSRVPRIQLASAVLSGLQGLDLCFFRNAVSENAYQQCIEAIPELMKSFPRVPQQSYCQDSAVCYVSLAHLENELLYDIFALFFRASSLTRAAQEGSFTAEVALFQNILMHARNSISKSTCAFSEIRPLRLRDSFSSLKILGNAPIKRRDWRSGLAETLMLNAQTSHDNLINKVEEICYELEQRCQDVETPLRVAAEERDKVSQETEAAKQLNHELEVQLQQATNSISELHQDVANLETHAEIAATRAEELSESLDIARKELEELRRESQETALSEREKARTRELDLIASMTEKEDRLEGLQEDLRAKEEEKSHVQQSLSIALDETALLRDDQVILKQEVSELQEHLEKIRSQTARKDDEFRQLLETVEDTEARAETLQIKLDEEVTGADHLRSALKKAETEFEIEEKSIRERLELQIYEVNKECAQRNENISSLRRAMQAAASNADKELQTKDHRIQYLEKKVQHMRNERSSKAREFSEAQQHIGRLMNVMGFKADPVSSKPSSKQPPTPGQPQSAKTPKQTRSGGYPQIQGDDDSLDMSFISDMSFSGRRSPKRPRNNDFPPHNVLPPSPAPGRKTRESVCRSNTEQRRGRKALGEVDQNSQPNSQETAKSISSQRESFPESQFCGNLDENRLQDIDLDMDLEFSKDFLFTSTSMSEANNAAPKVAYH